VEFDDIFTGVAARPGHHQQQGLVHGRPVFGIDDVPVDHCPVSARDS
jgi:molybdopterin biosynthesis enzyme